MTPRFSVILPVYNVEKYLTRCVESVLQQSFSDFELLLVDDGSTDGSGALCHTFEDHRIRVIHQENGGLAAARNTGLREAKGEYIWWVDSDDWIRQDSLQYIYEAMEGSTPDVVKFNHFRVIGEKETLISGSAAPGHYDEKGCADLLRQALQTGGKFVLSACFMVYRREFLLEHDLHFVSERLVGSEDYLFNLECLLYVREALVIPRGLYCYELHPGSLTQSYKKDLPHRYGVFYRMLRETYEKAGALTCYEEMLAYYYLWHLLRGTCMSDIYNATREKAPEEGRAAVKSMLCAPEVKEACSRLAQNRYPMKKRLQLWAMKVGFEPLFYHLFVK